MPPEAKDGAENRAGLCTRSQRTPTGWLLSEIVMLTDIWFDWYGEERVT